MQVRGAETLSKRLLRKAKLAGLSDVQIAHLRRLGDEGENTIRELRWNYGLPPVFKTVATCAAEFAAHRTTIRAMPMRPNCARGNARL